ncbi:MAG: 30S ribosomal protein S9, partial [Bacteroidia bacterium]
KVSIKVNVNGGGISGQAGAVSLAIAKALVQGNEEVRGAMRQFGLMTRDSRKVERKKPGQKKARKRFQFSKR